MEKEWRMDWVLMATGQNWVPRQGPELAAAVHQTGIPGRTNGAKVVECKNKKSKRTMGAFCSILCFPELASQENSIQLHSSNAWRASLPVPSVGLTRLRPVPNPCRATTHHPRAMAMTGCIPRHRSTQRRMQGSEIPR